MIDAWQMLARVRGLEVIAHVASPLDVRLAGALGGVALDVHAREVAVGAAASMVHSSVVGRAASTSTGFVRVTSATELSALAAHLGFERRITGDRDFDARFFVEGVSDPSVRAMLPPPVRARLLAFAHEGPFEHEHAGATVSVRWEAATPDPARVEAAMALVVAICAAPPARDVG